MNKYRLGWLITLIIFLTLVFAIVLVISIVLVIYMALPSPGYIRDAQSTANKIQYSVGEARLRGWAVKIIDQYRIQTAGTNNIEIPEREIPVSLSRLGGPFSPTAVLFPGSPNQEHVALGWVSGRGGVVIHLGRTNFVEPQLGAHLYCIKFADGIYILTSKD